MIAEVVVYGAQQKVTGEMALTVPVRLLACEAQLPPLFEPPVYFMLRRLK